MRSGATKQNERITNLDTVRGIATLGILVMNAVNFAISDPAYFNLDAGGSNNSFDWVVGVALFILCVWCIQLMWSKSWLTHFRFGPAEWVWRIMTYRKYQPLRRGSQK